MKPTYEELEADAGALERIAEDHVFSCKCCGYKVRGHALETHACPNCGGDSDMTDTGAISEVQGKRLAELQAFVNAAVRWREAINKAGMTRPCDLPLVAEIEIITR